MVRVIAILSLIVAGFLAYSYTSQAEEKPAPVAAESQSESAAEVPASAFTERVLGDPKAPITFIEYAMLTCSHCAEFHNKVLPDLKKQYIDTGKLKIVFRDYPFDEIALRAAMAARCVPEDKFFDYVSVLFQQQNIWSRSEQPLLQLKQLAAFAGLSPSVFEACQADQKLMDHLLKVRVDASEKFQIDSTPTFIVEGTSERLLGAQSVEQFSGFLNRKLTELGVAIPSAPVAAPVPAAVPAP